MDTKREMNRYASAEKKLQLVRQIRQEQQMNQNTVRGREAFLYGDLHGNPYKALHTDANSNLSGNHSYISFQEADANVPTLEHTMISTFRLRMAAALLLFGLFYTLEVNDREVFGIQTSMVYEAVKVDYSPILFDFIEEIPYTLQE